MPDTPATLLWGSPPFDERDLDALFSGVTDGLPGALRPVAGTLAALRAAPAVAELAGEAAARAAFRAFAPSAAERADEAEHGTVLEHTLPLSPWDRGQRGTARHRRHRRHRAGPRSPGLRRPAVLAAFAAAAAAVAAAAAFAGVLPGQTRPLPPFGHHAQAGTASVSVEGSARVLPSPRAGTKTPGKPAPRPTVAGPAQPSAPRSTSGLGALCRQYFGFYAHPEPAASWPAEFELWQQLSKLAGGSPWKACLPYVDYPPGGTASWAPPPPRPGEYPGGPGPGGPGNPGGDGGQQSWPPQGDGPPGQPPPGHGPQGAVQGAPQPGGHGQPGGGGWPGQPG